MHPSPFSPWPFLIGVAAVVTGGLGLLLTATAAALVCVITWTGHTTDPHGRAMMPALLTVVSLLGFAALLVAVAPLARGLDRGRSAGAWMAGVLVPWVLFTGFFFAVVSFFDEFDEAARKPALLGFGSAVVLAPLLVTGAVLLGIRPGRRWLAHRILSAGPAEAGPGVPEPLLRARRRYSTAVLLSVIGTAGSIGFLPLSALGDDPLLGATLAITAGAALLLIVGPLILARAGATRALAGRARGATVARFFSAGPLFFLQLVALLVVLAGGVGLVASEAQVAAAVLPPVPQLAIGIALAAVLVAAEVFLLAGLAALSDPHSDRHLAFS
ncbi:hypothetical protein AB0J80_31530 [Actinoplanes sp. NPDC049548]|uniref:hypothetical protein n=1 Tax=Actinoplanes sp. NPDC049548 TaxID=3155152 RepID=UPI0034441A94